jgi:dihydrofolate synthase / folylpolyglutamate synthase
MTYTDAIRFLYELRVFGAKFGLENALKLAALAGNPQDKLRFIHVAGTNGKGSTCAMLEGIYRAAGLRVGLFTSPHLVSFAERIQVNRRFISELDVVRSVMKIEPMVMALGHFAGQNCDLVIWETGLGGRLDATNIVTPLASVITNIGIEHSEWLGDTFEKIAREKAGIIKTGLPVITAAKPGEGLEVVTSIAREKCAPLTVVDATGTNRAPLDQLALPLHGPHQRLNAATALATVQALAGQIPVPEEALKKGLATVQWPGRMQRVQTGSGRTILLDGAHNPAGAEALRAALEAEFPDAKPTMIFGVFRDKDSGSMCRSLAPLAGRILLTPVHTDRTEDPVKLVHACRESNPRAVVEVCASLSEALTKSSGDCFLFIAGSLYLVGEAMELLQLVAAPPDDEKRLNEWSGKR